ncbi:unnamed protein product, partial [Rotaria sp. Silwood2]
ICIGELSLTGLTPNFASRTLEISICMDIDANGLLQIEAEESRSGTKTKLTIDPKNCKNFRTQLKFFLQGN